MSTGLTYHFGPFINDHWHWQRSYYKLWPALKIFFPPHVDYIASFVNISRIDIKDNETITVEVGVDDEGLLTGHFSFTYPYSHNENILVEVAGNLLRGKLHGDYSITHIRDNDKPVSLISATFVEGLVHGPVYKIQSIFVDRTDYQYGKHVSPSLTYSWINQADKDLTIRLPPVPYPYFPPTVYKGLKLLSFSEYADDKVYIFIVNNRGDKELRNIVVTTAIPYSRHQSLVREIVVSEDGSEYLGSEDIVDNDDKESLFLRNYSWPGSNTNHGAKAGVGPAAYGGIYQQFGMQLTDNLGNSFMTPSFVPYVNEYQRWVVIDDTKYIISYRGDGNARSIGVYRSDGYKTSINFNDEGNVYDK